MKKVLRKILSIALATSVVMACFTATAFAATTPVGVSYSAHVQDIGWQAAVTDGLTAGTSGQSKRVEALKVSLTNAVAGAHINYQVHVQDHGWMPVASDGALAGTTGESKRIEAIAMTISGLTGYSIEYRVHVQDIGWMSWVKNGAITGTVGQSKRIEAIQIRVVAPVTLAVTSVNATSASQILVNFNKAVNKASAETVGNYSISGGTIASAVMASDKMSVVLTTNGPITGTNLYVVQPITSDASATEKSAIFTYVETYADTKAPVVSKVEYLTYQSVKVTYSEPMADFGSTTFVQNGAPVNIPASYTVDSVTYDLSAAVADKPITVTSVGGYDRANNLTSPNPIVLSLVKSKTDTVVPTVVNAKAIGDNKVEITFSEKLNGNPTATVGGAAVTFPAYDATLANTVFTGTFAPAASGVAVISVAAGYQDTSSNAGAAYTKLDTFATDTTKPTVVSSELQTIGANLYVVVHYSEAVTAGPAVTLDVTRVLNYISYNETIPGSPIPYLKVNGTSADDTKSVMFLITGISNGAYTATLPSGYVSDTASTPNASASTTISFAKGDFSATDTTAPTAYYDGFDTGNVYMYVGFSEAMDPATALNVANYKVNGTSIFSAAIFDGSADYVKLTVIPGTITLSGTYALTVTGVKDKALNVLTPFSSNEYFNENVKPSVASAVLTNATTVTVTFNEDVTGSANAFEFYVDGVKTTVAATNAAVVGSKTVAVTVPAVSDLTKTYKIKLVGTDYVDSVDNTAINNVLVTVTH